MKRLRLSACVVIVTLAATGALAAGGGGSAGGAGAQNQPASGLPLGEAGPLGSTNNPRKTAVPDRPNTATTNAEKDKAAAPAHEIGGQ